MDVTPIYKLLKHLKHVIGDDKVKTCCSVHITGTNNTVIEIIPHKRLSMYIWTIEGHFMHYEKLTINRAIAIVKEALLRCHSASVSIKITSWFGKVTERQKESWIKAMCSKYNNCFCGYSVLGDILCVEAKEYLGKIYNAKKYVDELVKWVVNH